MTVAHYRYNELELNVRRALAPWLAIVLPALTAPLCLASPESQYSGFEFIVDRDAAQALQRRSSSISTS